MCAFFRAIKTVTSVVCLNGHHMLIPRRGSISPWAQKKIEKGHSWASLGDAHPMIDPNVVTIVT